MSLNDDIPRWKSIKNLEIVLYKRVIHDDFPKYLELFFTIQSGSYISRLISDYPWLETIKQKRSVPQSVGISNVIDLFRRSDAYREVLTKLPYPEIKTLIDMRNEFVMRHSHLVHSCIIKNFPWVKLNDKTDAFNMGVLGLLRALDRWDPERGAYTTYAYSWVFQVMRRQEMNVGHTVRQPVYLWDSGRRPVKNLSLDSPCGHDTDTTFYNFFATVEAPQDDACLQSQQREVIPKYLSRLTPIQKYILRKRFGIDGRGGKTREEISTYFDVTRERIRQLEEKALKSLRFFVHKDNNYDNLIMEEVPSSPNPYSLGRTPSPCGQKLQLELVNCVYYMSCLYEAAKQRWKGMTCEHCEVLSCLTSKSTELDVKLARVSPKGMKCVVEAVNNSLSVLDLYKSLQSTGDVEESQLTIVELSAELRSIRRKLAENPGLDVPQYLAKIVAERRRTWVKSNAKKRAHKATKPQATKPQATKPQATKPQATKVVKEVYKEKPLKNERETVSIEPLSSCRDEKCEGSFIVRPDGSIVVSTLEDALTLSKMLREQLKSK